MDNQTEDIIHVIVDKFPEWSKYELFDVSMSAAELFVTSMLVIVTSFMVYFIKKDFDVKTKDMHLRTSVDSIREIRSILERLESHRPHTIIINNMTQFSQGKINKFPETEIKNIHSFFNELTTLAILWTDGVVSIEHIRKNFEIMFISIDKTPDVKNQLELKIHLIKNHI